MLKWFPNSHTTSDGENLLVHHLPAFFTALPPIYESVSYLYGWLAGYFAADGNMDTCIVLRTAIVKDGRMYVQAGAGVVADSDPDAEQMECVYKARALFRAADEAVRFAEARRRGNR